MAIEYRRNVILVSFLVVALLLTGGYLWANRGYGEVSPKTYEFSKALYGACLKKSDQHLLKVENLLAEADAKTLPSNERAWLEQIVKLARSGDWEPAAKRARRMMEDQVEY